jgi:hypothetical protein
MGSLLLAQHGYLEIALNDGCATIGGTIIIHDASSDADGIHGNWSWPGYIKCVPSKTPSFFFSSLAAY